MTQPWAGTTTQSSAVRLNHVTISGIDVPFWDLVIALVKLSLASIPAMIILVIFYVVVVATIGGALAGVGTLLHR